MFGPPSGLVRVFFGIAPRLLRDCFGYSRSNPEETPKLVRRWYGTGTKDVRKTLEEGPDKSIGITRGRNTV